MSNDLRPEDQYVHIIRVPTAMFIALCMAKRFIHIQEITLANAQLKKCKMVSVFT